MTLLTIHMIHYRPPAREHDLATTDHHDANKHRRVRTSMIVVLAGAAVAYYSGGLSHSVFANTGLDDGLGHIGFWITWILGYGGLTVATVGLYIFGTTVHKEYSTFDDNNNRSRSSICGVTALRMFVAFNVLAYIGITVGCMWCLLTPSLHTSSVNDSVNKDDPDVSTPTCVNLFANAENVWFISQPLCFLPLARLLMPILRQHAQVTHVWGIPPPTALKGSTVAMWTLGFMFFPYMAFVSIIVLQSDDLGADYATIRGPIIHHAGVLISYYLMHAVGIALPISNGIDENNSHNININIGA